MFNDGYFYVYHSSDNSVEKISLSSVTGGTFDITNLVSNGYLYGGYYSDYNRKGANYSGGTDGLTEQGGRYYDVGGTSYDGGLGYWSGSNAYTTSIRIPARVSFQE